MSEIDMKSYAGASNDSAAEGQYVQDSNVVNVHEEAVGNPQERAVQQSAPVEEPSRQELNFRALTGEVERIKAERETERREYQLNLELMKANMAPRAAEPPPQAPRKMFEGMEDNDLPTTAQIRQEWSERENQYQNRLNEYQGTIQEMQVALSNPDYVDVVTKYATPLIKNDPILAQGVNGAENKALYVYRLGKLAQQMEQNKAQAPVQQVNPQAQRIVENSRKPGNLGSAGGQSALSQADYFASMSDQEFMKYASRNLEGI